MAKQGMKRPDRTNKKPGNDVAPVPEIQGKAKSGKVEAMPIVEDGRGRVQRVYHVKPGVTDKPIASAYGVLDTDLARDNLENDLATADVQDL